MKRVDKDPSRVKKGIVDLGIVSQNQHFSSQPFPLSVVRLS